MTDTLNAVAIAGSLRAGSFNRALMRAAIERAPDGLEIEAFDLADIPMYNGDVEAEGDPPAVTELKGALHAADLIFLVTPEYNGGLPAVLKNAIDWGSRPPRPQAWDGKPVAVMGATPGTLGTLLAQNALRQILGQLNARLMPQPRLLVRGARKLFDEELRLVDEDSIERLDKFLDAAAEWARTFHTS